MDTYSNSFVAQQTSLLEEITETFDLCYRKVMNLFVCFIDFCSIKVLNREHYRQNQKHYRQNQEHYGWCE